MKTRFHQSMWRKPFASTGSIPKSQTRLTTDNQQVRHMPLVDVRVPNIGDFDNVPVVEIQVKPGDEVKPDDPLITLESDKAAMDVPSPQRGKVSEILVSIGDKVSEGSAILRLDVSGDDSKPEPKSGNGKSDEPPNETPQQPAEAAPPKPVSLTPVQA